MSRGYSTPALVCLCALAFICGRFLDILPGLPEANTGVRLPFLPLLGQKTSFLLSL